MKKKGFTLVELLAVIVILAIIALIATPLILNVIDNAKKGAIENSAYGYIDAVEKSILEEELKGNIKSKSKVYNVSELDFVNIKGDIPTEGWVIFIEGEIKAYSLKFDDYVINLEKNQVKTEKGNAKELTTCMALNIQDDDSYTYGDSYMCDPGDGIYRIFYMLEDGDNTTLVKGDTGIADTGELSLIMSENIDNDSFPWASKEDYIEDGGTEAEYGKWGRNDRGPLTVNKKITEKTSNWSLPVTLPTAYQIALATGYTEFEPTTTTEVKLPTWLSNDKYNIGYFTSTTAKLNYKVFIVAQAGQTDYTALYNAGSVYFHRGLRPVITVSKDKIS